MQSKSEPRMLRKKIEIINKLGLHARASAKFVAHATRYGSHVEVSKGDQTVNGKSIMGVMMLAAAKGSIIELTIEGEDEIAMLDDLTQLIQNRFEEEE